ncbi:MAG: histidine phosphatase family protein [Gammaproteobacteria bacterium]|nr:histidine phosphatase family protein [Gammaproteobacteria bacterium]MBU1603081.1 histidine phosphatase family protein [Gammaproteobacteria bacterium]MBU2433786.1 histidine phosphatase family protein [Gammaproteobacteria bacterium]MBU2449956.1 histidine phosphatase family protein [Gammaproteobacteria bacterium]
MKFLAILLAASALALPPAWGADQLVKPAFVEKPITPELLGEIRTGGFVLYMRHGNTDNSRPDRVPSVDLNDCTTQRPLNDEGRQLMKRVGQEIRDAGLPIGDILVSPMCRTLESARLAIGDKFQVVESLMYSANMTSEEKKPRIEALKKLLALPVATGTNTLMIAHAPNLADLIGFFVKPEGTVVVFRVGGPNIYEYAASIHPDDWRKLPK